ncbi:hypothetical protein H0H81_009779, partial [Sphagnurus paluster]
MILLAAVPEKWNGIISTILMIYGADKFTWLHVAEAIIGEYKKNQNLSGSSKQSSKSQSANKLSAVKRQKPNPQWNSTRSSDQAPKPHYQQGQKKQRGGKNHKGKGKAQQTHIASLGVIPDA